SFGCEIVLGEGNDQGRGHSKSGGRIFNDVFQGEKDPGHAADGHQAGHHGGVDQNLVERLDGRHERCLAGGDGRGTLGGRGTTNGSLGSRRRRGGHLGRRGRGGRRRHGSQRG